METVISESLIENHKSSFNMLNRNWVFILLFNDNVTNKNNLNKSNSNNNNNGNDQEIGKNSSGNNSGEKKLK